MSTSRLIKKTCRKVEKRIARTISDLALLGKESCKVTIFASQHEDSISLKANLSVKNNEEFGYSKADKEVFSIPIQIPDYLCEDEQSKLKAMVETVKVFGFIAETIWFFSYYGEEDFKTVMYYRQLLMNPDYVQIVAYDVLDSNPELTQTYHNWL